MTGSTITNLTTGSVTTLYTATKEGVVRNIVATNNDTSAATVAFTLTHAGITYTLAIRALAAGATATITTMPIPAGASLKAQITSGAYNMPVAVSYFEKEAS